MRTTPNRLQTVQVIHQPASQRQRAGTPTSCNDLFERVPFAQKPCARKRGQDGREEAEDSGVRQREVLEWIVHSEQSAESGLNENEYAMVENPTRTRRGLAM